MEEYAMRGTVLRSIVNRKKSSIETEDVLLDLSGRPNVVVQCCYLLVEVGLILSLTKFGYWHTVYPWQVSNCYLFPTLSEVIF